METAQRVERHIVRESGGSYGLLKEFYNKKRRVKRGLFKSNDGKLINSDINGSLRIMKKVFPNAYESRLWDSGCVMQPVKVSFAA